MVSDNIIKLFVPIVKTKTTSTKEGKQNYVFTGILSDDSLDRDDEMMSPTLLKGWAEKGSIPGLINHDNKMESYVADFTNLRTVEKEGNTMLVGDIEFFPLPESESVKVKLIHGRHMGLSVSAIPHGTEMVNKTVRGKDKECKMFTKGELLEGSFIPVQSNRTAHAFAVAKSFKLNTQTESTNVDSNEQINEVKKMINEKKEVIVNEEVKEPKPEEKVFDIKKAFEDLNKEFESLKKELIIKSEKKPEDKKPEEVVKDPKVEVKKIDIDTEKVVKEALPTKVVKIVKETDSLKKLLNKVYGGNK